MYRAAPLRTIVAKYRNGISSAELEYSYEGSAFMDQQARRKGDLLIGITLGDDLYRFDYKARIETIKKTRKHIAIEQGRAGLPNWQIEIIELLGEGGLHAHLIVYGNSGLFDTLKNASWLAPYARGDDAIQVIEEAKGGWKGWHNYLTKERTPEADLIRKWAMPERLPATALKGVGDRVRISENLKAQLIERKRILPFEGKNWNRDALKGVWSTPYSKAAMRRLKEKERADKPIVSASQPIKPVPALEPMTMVQEWLFPELDKPVAHLTDFWGGMIPSGVASQIEHERRRRGLTQKQLGRIACVSQPQIANALAGRFGLSARAARNLKTALGIAV